MRILGLALLLVVISSPLLTAQQAQEFPSTSGNAFARMCSVIDEKSEEETPLDIDKAMACIGYVEGVVQGISEEVAYAWAISNKKPPMPFCLPDRSENGQLVKVVLKYIENHPEEAHKPTAFLITVALKDAFPCTSSDTGEKH